MSVVVYSTPTCPYCHMVKDYFRQNKVEFTDYDVASDHSKAQEMVQKSGQMGVPVVDINGSIIVGFDKDRINSVLGL